MAVDRDGNGYARAADGAYVGYHVYGDGPPLVWQFDWFGNLDAILETRMWAEWFDGLGEFARVILHDRRGTGVSSRDVPAPSLETRISDLGAVLDEVGIDQPVVLGGQYEGGAPNVLFAATYPERVSALLWLSPSARSTWMPDYPWGVRPDYVELDQEALGVWGTAAYGRQFREMGLLEGVDISPEEVGLIGKISRQTCTPDMAAELAMIWYQTDVRAALAAVQVPTLLIANSAVEDSLAEAEYLAALMSNATVGRVPGSRPGAAHLELVRELMGVSPPRPHLDTVLATVMFTDIVDSTRVQAERGDSGWKQLVERHHQIVRTVLAAWHGTEIDTAGDGFFAAFDGPARAIRCAREIAEAVGDLGIEIRSGVHTGECELIDGKPGGITVSIGARVGALAGPSQTLVSQTVKDLVAGSGLTFVEEGEHTLKGVPDTWRLYAAEG